MECWTDFPLPYLISKLKVAFHIIQRTCALTLDIIRARLGTINLLVRYTVTLHGNEAHEHDYSFSANGSITFYCVASATIYLQ